MRSLILITALLACPAVMAQQNISRVNGAIQTEAGARYGTLETVNGAISVESGVSAGEVETVNGSIRVAENASIVSAETVNGSILIGENVVVKGDLESVSGRVDVGAGSHIGGDIEVVNGIITLTRARIDGDVEGVNGGINLHGSQVGGDIESVNGDILIGRDSVVRGDLIMHKKRGFSFGFGASRKPKVTIEAGATVEGRLRFEREVELSISPDAKVRHTEAVEG